MERSAEGPESGMRFRDKDPPPTYDGVDPESTFQLFERRVRLWQFETDIPASKQGAKLIRALTGVASLATEAMEFEDITSEDGVKNVMQQLKEFFNPHLEVSLPRAFEQAVYGTPRTAKESFVEYVARMDRQFKNLAREGVTLPDEAIGYIVYRQASLNEGQDQKVLTWTQGKYGRAAMITSLRRLDKVIREKARGHFWEEAEGYERGPAGNEEASDEEYIYIEEGDLDQVMDEDKVQTALASYREMRQALKDQRTSRGYFPPKGKGKGTGKQRVHVEQLKLRTRCNRCGVVGHWARECPQPRTTSTSTATPSASSSAPAKTGFYVAHPAQEDASSAFWLKQFVEQQEAVSDDSAAEEAYKERGLGLSNPEGAPMFCGITTESMEGIVDTAAEGGLIGSEALGRLTRELARHGLKPKWTNKKASAKGVGGTAQSLGVVLIPIGLGQIHGILEATVVQGDVPFLLPISMLRALGAVIDIGKEQMHTTLPRRTIPMRTLPSGHVVVAITEFGVGPFRVHADAGTREDFEVVHDDRAAMSAQKSSHQFVGERLPFDEPVAQPCEEQGKIEPGRAGPSGEDWAQRPQGAAKLASSAGQDRHDRRPSGHSKPGGRLVSIACTFGAIYRAGLDGIQDVAGPLRPHHRPWGACYGSFEVQDTAYGAGSRLSTPQEGSSRWRECGSLLHLMQSMPQSVEEHPQGYGAQTDGEGLASGRSPESGGDQPSAYGARSPEGGSQSGEGARPVERSLRSPAGRDEVSAEEDGSHGGEAPGGTEGGDQSGGSQPATFERRDDPSAAGSRQQREEDAGHDAGDGHSALDRNQELGQDGTVHIAGQGQARDSGKSPGPEQESPQGVRGHPDQLEAHRFGVGDRGGVRLTGEWCVWPDARTRLWARRCQRRGQGREPGHRFSCETRYEVWDHIKQQWTRREGYVPLQADGSVRVWATMTARAEVEDWWEEGRDSSFTKGQRRLLTGALASWDEQAVSRPDSVVPGQRGGRDLVAAESTDGHQVHGPGSEAVAEAEGSAGYAAEVVAEVYSPPCVAREAAKMGFEPGESVDLLTGWDLSTTKDSRRMWRMLQEEQPMLIVLSPPCTAFSNLQNLNYPRMEKSKAVALIRTGLEHLRLAVAVARWQHREGRYFVFEQPASAASWDEEEVRRMTESPEVIRVVGDQCMYGLNVDGEGPNKKPTGFATNSPEIAKKLARRCDGSHFHAPTMSGKPRKAQIYPAELVKAILRGLRRQLEMDGLQHGFVQEAAEEEEQDQAEVELTDGTHRHTLPPGFVEDPSETLEGYQITAEEKAAVRRLHANTGHPQKADMIRFMKAARVRSEVIRWVAREFKCESCEARAQPRAHRPAMIPRSYQPNQVLGVDLVFLPDVGGGTFPALSMVDWGTNYQMVERVSSKSPTEVWNTMLGTWCRVFGPPEVLVADPGKEITAEFMKNVGAYGMVMYQTASRAPWQQGKTERHGAHFKELLAKARSEVVITTRPELKQLMVEVEQAKNRYLNRSGFSPVQRQIGQWPRVPGSLLSDEQLDPSLLDGVRTDDIERLHEMRRVAHKAFVDFNSQQVLKRAVRARSRTTAEYRPGDYVFVYRVPQVRRQRDGTRQAVEIGSNRPLWVGPGSVIVADGPNLWVSMMGQLWRVAREQCRPATNSERTGVEEIMNQCRELVEEYKQTSHRAGYKDITRETLASDYRGHGAGHLVGRSKGGGQRGRGGGGVYAFRGRRRGERERSGGFFQRYSPGARGRRGYRDASFKRALKIGESVS